VQLTDASKFATCVHASGPREHYSSNWCNECKAFDQGLMNVSGLLNVSGHLVQLTDASEFAT
jgi:hypothetical protein